jgi:hypothetical protein
VDATRQGISSPSVLRSRSHTTASAAQAPNTLSQFTVRLPSLIPSKASIALALRKVGKFKAFQAYLVQASELIDPSLPPNWMAGVVEHHEKAVASLEMDFANWFECPIEAVDTLGPYDRSMFWREHPQHAWYGFMREDWIEAVSKGSLAKIHSY